MPICLSRSTASPRPTCVPATPTRTNATERPRCSPQRCSSPAARWTCSFQSRFGAARWIEPATATLLTELPRRNLRAVTVICPGFAADCLETLEEIELEARAAFLKAGGERFDYVPALNASPRHVHALASLLRRHAGDWMEAGGDT